MPGYHPREGIRPGSEYKGLCVFDMDNTLTRDMLSTTKSCGTGVPTSPHWSLPPHGVLPVHQYPAVYAKEAVSRCLGAGFAVGVATAAPCTPPPAIGDPGGKHARASLQTRMKFLKDLGMPIDVVYGSKPVHQGPAYQCIEGEYGSRLKSTMVGNLMSYYGVPPEKTVFFDDQQKFLDEVKGMHPKVTTQLASSRECHGKVCLKACGLRREEFDRGLGKVLLKNDPKSAAVLMDTIGLTGQYEKGDKAISKRCSPSSSSSASAVRKAGPPAGVDRVLHRKTALLGQHSSAHRPNPHHHSHHHHHHHPRQHHHHAL